MLTLTLIQRMEPKSAASCAHWTAAEALGPGRITRLYKRAVWISRKGTFAGKVSTCEVTIWLESCLNPELDRCRLNSNSVESLIEHYSHLKTFNLRRENIKLETYREMHTSYLGTPAGCPTWGRQHAFCRTRPSSSKWRRKKPGTGVPNRDPRTLAARPWGPEALRPWGPGPGCSNGFRGDGISMSTSFAWDFSPKAWGRPWEFLDGLEGGPKGKPRLPDTKPKLMSSWIPEIPPSKLSLKLNQAEHACSTSS